MKLRLVLCLLFAFVLTGYAGQIGHLVTEGKAVHFVPQVPDAAGDTIYITGSTLAGEIYGELENTINADTNTGGTRKNPNRVYALYQGQYYFQVAPINIHNATGKLTLAGVPSASGTTKPIILILPVPPATGVTANVVYGSIKCDGIHYQCQALNGSFQAELFYCGTANNAAQSLELNNCLFEFSNIDLFDCTNETGAIGGWPNGAKFKITNNYFRNMFNSGQWWGSRVYQCKHPIDTAWFDNNTVTTGGLTFLQQNNLTDFMYVNHNTIVNNKKYWLLSPYHKAWFCTNNIFINQNWVGEDTNVTNSGQDPDKLFMSTINVDTNNITNGLTTQKRYWLNGTDSTKFVPALGLNKIQIYISDNVNYYDPLLTSGYYSSSKYVLTPPGTIPSYLNWAGAGTGPWKIGNAPGMWMNSRTTALFAAYGPGNGGFIEKRTSVANPGTATPGIASAAVVDTMARWNQNQWGDSRFTTSGITKSGYIYGDYDPTTLPGIVSGHKVDTMTTGKAGITKFTDLTENFAQSGLVSAIDGLPVGSLIWDDAKNAAYNPSAAWASVYAKYIAEGGLTSVSLNQAAPGTYSLSQNYPNPFNPSTTIEFSLPKQSAVDLKVFNILGQEVATLVHETLPSGVHSVRFDATHLASGTYIVRISAGDFTSAKKMLLLK